VSSWLGFSLVFSPLILFIQCSLNRLMNPRIWLSSLTRALKAQPTNRPYLHGFDISSAQYPFYKDITPSHELYLSVHDIRNRFPLEHRERYDLVHVRLLVGALKEEDYSRSMRNLYELLSMFQFLYIYQNDINNNFQNQEATSSGTTVTQLPFQLPSHRPTRSSLGCRGPSHQQR
jgi:hypothetical protein